MRVIAGRARGRPLLAPKVKSVRPTSDKVKGVIFSMLEAEAYRRGFEPGEDEEGNPVLASGRAWPRVLDLFAGSGALGIEALSRGARWADFVERNAEARRTILENLRRTGLADRAAVHGFPARLAPSTLTGPYDLILCDPPYAEPGIPELLRELARSRLVHPGSALVYEHGRSTSPPARLDGLELKRQRFHGSTAVSLYLTMGERVAHDGGARPAEAAPGGDLPGAL